MDVIAGTRMVDMQQRLSWTVNGNLGPISAAARTGSSEVSETLWDAIVGVKGKYSVGTSKEWSIPFYVDIGTGQSTLTWQA
ncbi:hypothetical protein, partial [Klebsiella pneumoniae]|uniref:hypothetical protein n=1 Tax=Klebsiella pneumoniae TaxID=573 RepID=UPI001915CA6F